ncbi:MAG: hypothetical protein IPK16_21700 [Anaerolineales bacterium]|nr:hypothetical protein [Anaerolineales bacterium]
MTSAKVTTTPPVRLTTSRIAIAGLIAIVASVIANLIVYFIGNMIWPPMPDFNPLATPIPTIIFTTVFLIGATIVYWLINRFTKNPPRVFLIVAWIVFLVGLVPDFMMIINPASSTMGTPTTGSVITLIIMHVVAFAITLWVFLRWAPSKA